MISIILQYMLSFIHNFTLSERQFLNNQDIKLKVPELKGGFHLKTQRALFGRSHNQ